MAEAVENATAPAIRLSTVLFDFDGTLADTAPDLGHALNLLLEESGRPALPLEALRPHASHGSIGLIRFGFGLRPEDKGFEALRGRYLELYEQHLAVATRLFPGAGESLAALESRGLRWGIVTNKPGWLTAPLVRMLGLSVRAACVVSGDTTPRRKPDPDPLLHACEVIGCRPAECLYIGDAERDIIAGRRAGMTTLVARFGYIDHDERPEEWGADGVIDALPELLDWLDDRE